MSNEFLSQEEVDILLQQAGGLTDHPAAGGRGTETEMAPGEAAPAGASGGLSALERDVLGEIGNISMGAAATALSEIVNHKVTITTPRVRITTPAALFRSFQIPYVVVRVEYTTGLTGDNLLIMRVSDASVIADLMLGGEGRRAVELEEIGVSALAEAMNQMIGSAATSMSSMFRQVVRISPPRVAIFDAVGETNGHEFYPWKPEEEVAVVAFRMAVEGLIDSELLQVIPLAVAKQEATFLLEQQTQARQAGAAGPPQDEPVMGGAPGEAAPAVGVVPPVAEVGQEPAVVAAPQAAVSTSAPPPRNLDLLLDVPLEVTVIMGRTRRPIKEILNLVPGAVVELDNLVDEPVEILVNGTLVAQGEVVVVNENFGVRITQIISPAERLKYLR